MKTKVTAVLILVLLLAAHAAAQTSEGARGQGQGTAPPAPQVTSGLAEAARLNAEAVRLHAAGKYAEAEAAAAQAVELRERALGPQHSSVGGALLNLAAAESALGKSDEAKAHYRRAAELLKKAGGEAQTLLTVLEGQAQVEHDLTRSVKLHQRILTLQEMIYGPESYQAAVTHVRLGHFAEIRGGQDEAERRFRHFIEVAGKSKGGSEDELAVVYARLACLLKWKGEEAEADAASARSDEIFNIAGVKNAPFDGGVLDGKTISKPPPAYPEAAKRARAQGTVTVKLIVGESGAVYAACAQEGDTDPSLKRASELAAYGARFSRAYVNGKNVKVRGTLTYNFVLR